MAGTNTYPDKILQDHLKNEHRRSPFSEYLKEIVYGGIDGIVTTFAVVAGFSGAQNGDVMMQIPLVTVLLFGFANLFADASSMGLGNFLSVRADQDVFRKEMNKERKEIQSNPDMEIKESVHILETRGFSKSDAETITSIYKKNEDYWVDFMMKDELQMPDPTDENPAVTALITFSSFILFGAIPLAPYILHESFRVESLFTSSILFTFSSMILLGLFRWKVTQQSIIRSVGETVLLGGVSAGIAYLVGTFFRV